MARPHQIIWRKFNHAIWRSIKFHGAKLSVVESGYALYFFDMKRLHGTTAKILLEMLSKHDLGRVFTPKDFNSITPADAQKTLARLAASGAIRRVSRGMYDVPRMSKLLGKPAPPSVDQIIAAVQRRDRVHIKPDDLAAANALGLTTAVLARPQYRTSGKRRIIRVGKTKIELRPAGHTLRAWIDTPAAIAIQALLFLGPEASKRAHVVLTMRRNLQPEAKKALSDMQKYRPRWMDCVIKQICSRSS